MARTIRIAVATACVAALTAAPALAHEGNSDFESKVTASGPAGLQVRVLSGDDRLQVHNETGKVVVIAGYEGEPYARLQPDGRVEINQRSPATFLNDDRLGDVDVPKSADPKAAPVWKAVDTNGRFEFHDHRIHWMAKGDPPNVRDSPAERQKVFDWAVPVTVGGAKAEPIRGELWWRGDGGSTPVGAFVALGVILLGSVALVVFVRHRRRAAEPKAEVW